jgi:hypothetical protein
LNPLPYQSEYTAIANSLFGFSVLAGEWLSIGLNRSALSGPAVKQCGVVPELYQR